MISPNGTFGFVPVLRCCALVKQLREYGIQAQAKTDRNQRGGPRVETDRATIWPLPWGFQVQTSIGGLERLRMIELDNIELLLESV